MMIRDSRETESRNISNNSDNEPLIFGSKAEKAGTDLLDHSSTDSDASETEQEIEPLTLESAKRFMIESGAFSRFYSELRYFVFPSTKRVEDQVSSTLELTIGRWLKPLQSIISQRTVPIITTFLLGICRPRVRKGHKRITWTCVSEISIRLISIIPQLISPCLTRAAGEPCMMMSKKLSMEAPRFWSLN